MAEASTADAPTTGAELDLWQQAYGQLAAEVRERWELDQVKTIRNTVGKGLSPAEFQMGMAIAARYDLDPLLKEIWFAKGPSKDGEPGQVMIMVGRDGLLRNARRQEDYAGFDSDVVHEKDVFKVRRLPTGEREIQHEYEGSSKARGEIVGAWAQVYQRGKTTTYFFAPFDEYKPEKYNRAWKTTPSVMIQKCALSLCLRLAFNLSGVVGEDEGARAWEEMSSGGPDVDLTDASILDDLRGELGDEVFDRLLDLFNEAAIVRPGQVTPTGVQMSVKGQSPEAVEAYLDRLAAENDLASEARREALADEDVVDAEVVEPDVEIDSEGLPDPTGGGAATAPPESPPTSAPSAAPSSDEEVDVEALRRRLSDLFDRQADLDAEGDADPAKQALLDEEVAEIEGQLRAAGETLPGQGALDV